MDAGGGGEYIIIWLNTSRDIVMLFKPLLQYICIKNWGLALQAKSGNSEVRDRSFFPLVSVSDVISDKRRAEGGC